MRRVIVLLLVLVVGLTGGYLVGSRVPEGDSLSAAGTPAGEPREKQPLYWVAPMDPNYRRDKPGKSPMGMDLVPVYEEAQDSGDFIRINPAVENNLGVRSELVKTGPLWRRIEATAYVDLDETLISSINVRTQGWITRLSIHAEGERVKKGDLLFELYSPELVSAQKEYLQASKRGDNPLLAAAAEKLGALGMIQADISALQQGGKASQSIRVVAPRDGIVSALNVREGSYIQPNTLVMSLVDLSSVWLQAEIFESQAEWVASGQAARATLDYLPAHEFNGQVDYVYPVLDPKTRTLRVRLRFENPEELLKPNMYARVSIYGKLHPNALSIPRQALIRSKGANRVVLGLGDGRFRVQEVLTGIESGEAVEILAGLEEGDRVVTSAQFLLDSEASLTGAISRLDDSVTRDTPEDNRPVIASGRLEAVYLDRKRVRVTHGPIDALAWPTMTMEFDVLGDVDLAAFDPGQNIRFTLQQQLAGEYAIVSLAQQAALDPITQPETGQVEQDDSTTGVPASRPAGLGLVVAIDRQARVMKLRHGPIEELGWPAMTMDFDVAGQVDITGLEEGQSIRFELGKDANDRFIIEFLELTDETDASSEEPASQPEHAHD